MSRGENERFRFLPRTQTGGEPGGTSRRDNAPEERSGTDIKGATSKKVKRGIEKLANTAKLS